MILKKISKAMSLRERTFLVIFLWSMVILWGTNSLKRWKVLGGQFKQVNLELADQNFQLEQQEEIGRRLGEALRDFDKGKTFDQGKLFGQMGSLTGQTKGWKGKVGIKKRESDVKDLFNRHVVKVEIKRASIGDLMKFDELVRAQAPYIGIESVLIEPDKRDPRLLKVDYFVSSFELRTDAVEEAMGE